MSSRGDASEKTQTPAVTIIFEDGETHHMRHLFMIGEMRIDFDLRTLRKNSRRCCMRGLACDREPRCRYSAAFHSHNPCVLAQIVLGTRSHQDGRPSKNVLFLVVISRTFFSGSG